MFIKSVFPDWTLKCKAKGVQTLETVTLNVLFYFKMLTLKNTKGFGRFKGFVRSFSAVETLACIGLRLQLHILWFISLIIARIENVSFKGLVEFARDLFFFF